MKPSILLAVTTVLANVSTQVASAPAPAPAPAQHIPASSDEQKLIGTWRLTRFDNTSKDGKVDKPYGDHPLGYFIYDATGHLSIQIMRNPPLPPFASANQFKATYAEKVQAYDAYVAYFGTYRVDQAHHVLHHQVEGALNTTYTNTDQLRPYRLDADTLVIELDDSKDGTHAYRELHRVH